MMQLIIVLLICSTFVSCDELTKMKRKDFNHLNVIKTQIVGSLPHLLKQCQNDTSKIELDSIANKTTIECMNKNEKIHIIKAEITNSAECQKSFMSSIYVSQLCNNENKCEISVDNDFVDICDDCSNQKILNLEYTCVEDDVTDSPKDSKSSRSKRSYSEKTKDKINRASRVLANNLGRVPLRFHYDAFYDPLYYEEDYFNDYYYYLDPRFRFLPFYN